MNATYLTIPQLKYLIFNKIDFFNAYNTLKMYGNIIKDINIEQTNKRYTIFKFRNKLFRSVKHNGEIIELGITSNTNIF